MTDGKLYVVQTRPQVGLDENVSPTRKQGRL